MEILISANEQILSLINLQMVDIEKEMSRVQIIELVQSLRKDIVKDEHRL